MSKRVREHPDYPFSDAVLEATVIEMEGFMADPPLTPIERSEVLEFVRLTRQYAFLERLVQGDILFDLPIHLDLERTVVERIAEREHDLLGLGAEPAGDLIDALDERGIKVFLRTRGPEPVETLTGAFFYTGEAGPALLAGAAAGPEALFILAHAYGHLVMDIDPYRSRFCRWRRGDFENLADSFEEQRADRFARALLLPDALVRMYLRGPLPDGGEAGADSGNRLSRIAVACDVPLAILWRRLGDLGLPRSASMPPARAFRKRKVDERRPTDLPERFVNLALAAFGHRLLDKHELSRFLRIAPERVAQFLEWCPIPRRRKIDAENPDEVGDAEEDAGFETDSD